jgi:hypothetical protein
MDVAGAQATSLQVAELVEQKQGMVAGAAEVAVVGRALLVAIGRADARIQVENHLLRRAAVVNPVDPKPVQIGQGGDVVVGRQKLALEASHLARRSSSLGHGSASNNPPHGRIVTEAVGVVDVLVAAEPPEGGLTEQADHPVLSVPSGPRVHQAFPRGLGQSESVIDFSERKKSRIGCDLRTVEFRLQPTVEIKP